MAHFAELDATGTVLRVLVVDNAQLISGNDESEEEVGIAFCQSLFGEDTNWLQTSYNGNFRKNFAGIGFSYNSTLDAFVPPSPYPSWILNEDTCSWEPPVPMPSDDSYYIWDEPSTSWTAVQLPDLPD